ncbi:4-hydroxythreonine-4-phosphate dehydrogenase PdxA [Geminicoccaceae bacterium 1502E]|nr:4-hydroxythreonine-4-phosphate dehydrogenase PdxA [Geminicoccaceae bacterium 1502E]
MTPTLALVMGDPAGIGPELMARLLADPLSRRARILAIGDRRLLERGAREAGVELDLPVVSDRERALASNAGHVFLDLANLDPATIARGVPTAGGGRSALENYGLALELAASGAVDAVTFVPFNKQAMRLVEETYEDELVWAAERLGWRGPCAEFNVIDEFWNARVTSHVPLAEVARLITAERIVERLRLTDAALREAGVEKPRIAVAALNPHAGDGGAFGREEIDVIAPAVEAARAQGLPADGPFPSDTVFVRATRGDYDAVLTMYHDQGQIAIKLLGFDKGVTVLGGLPVPITTPAHGTAYDIAGQGIANPEPTRRAFAIACTMAERRPRG